ncbi:hypothetical protein DH2020_007668 [Rehmannia glutinosa]|uniref:CCHC-type domain-containing protein n=1 Tax=Rehmannia glutinosa TaxID=99300 RepID=A0ABR0TYT4_REHGL
MANLAKLDFIALDIAGKNYMSWALDAEIHLDAKGLGDTIKEGNSASAQDKTKAMIFLRHHLDENLKIEYLTVKDPSILWKNMKERYDHLKLVILPKARYDWIKLRFQDFKSVSDYNSMLFKISSKLKLCGESITDGDMIEKTLSTFHALGLLLQQQYREKGFTKYSDLISCLLVAEQNNELLIKNHESQPTGSTPFPEVNATRAQNVNNFRGRVRGRGRGRGRGRRRFTPYNRDNQNNSNQENTSKHLKWNRNDKKGKEKVINPENCGEKCYRCGIKGHWSRTCRTAKHLVELYQASIHNKDKNAEAKFTSDHPEDDNFDDLNVDITHLDVADFFEHPEGRIDHLIGDGNV